MCVRNLLFFGTTKNQINKKTNENNQEQKRVLFLLEQPYPMGDELSAHGAVVHPLGAVPAQLVAAEQSSVSWFGQANGTDGIALSPSLHSCL